MNKCVTSLVEKADDKKKVNPLDLSSDQDLTVALMNLIALQDKTSGELHDFVSRLSEDLLERVVKNNDVLDVSRKLLGQSVRSVDMGNQELGKNSEKAYDFYNHAYELYSLFWGVNMGLIDVSDIKNVCGDK